MVEEGGVLVYFDKPLHYPVTQMDHYKKFNPVAISQAKILYQITSERKTSPPTELIQKYFQEIVKRWCSDVT